MDFKAVIIFFCDTGLKILKGEGGEEMVKMANYPLQFEEAD